MRLPNTGFLGFLLAGLGGVGACATAEDIGPFVHSGLGASGFGAISDAMAPGAGGDNSGNGGVSENGGLPANGGFPNNGGSTANGGALFGGSAGASSTGGATGSGGRASGGASSGGTAGAGGSSGSNGGTAGAAGAACADTDGDNATDCVEDGDGDPWTDKAIFNGLHVSRGNQCSAAGNCRENDTFAEVQSCMQGNIDEEKDQYSGWDWQNNPPDNIESREYGFSPNWTGSDSSWAAQWEGCIHFTTAGPHCFQITGGTSEGCAALYFNGNTGNADAQTDTGPKCFTVPAGNYPIFLHYTMDNGSSSTMHVQYCDAAGAAECTPSTALPAKMLRTSCP